MAGNSPGKGGAKGSARGGGNASNAALHDDEDKLSRRKVLFSKWKAKKRPNQMIDYSNSPSAKTK
jgi:hypothetical protein